MAADFSTPAALPQPAVHHYHAPSAQYPPTASGANTPYNLSPTSPRTSSNLPHHVPQIRPPKNPIYVPAALRRTQRPTQQSPPKTDSLMGTPNSSWSSANSTGFSQPSGDGTSIVSRIVTSDLHRSFDDGPLSPLTGPITKDHWQPDSSTPVCTASACQTPFGFFTRRHHCRKCGGIFCGPHSQQQVRLNEQALFHHQGELQRACDRCYSQFRAWEQLRTSRQNSESSGSTAAVQIDTPTAPKRPDNQRLGSIANSFSGAWNWSTF